MTFGSFFLAGFECTTGVNRHGEWIDQVSATQHDHFADEDYARLRAIGIRGARDGIRWPLVDVGGRMDFASAQPLLVASRRHGVQVVWDLFHFGFPLDANPFAPTFPERFAAYCWAAARHVAHETDGPYWFTPVNEPSFFAWAAGEVGLFAPHAVRRGDELKSVLVRAAVFGIDAIRDAVPGAGIVNVDAVCRVVTPAGRPDMADAVAAFNRDAVFQCWDMLAGRRAPELGGTPAHLGMLGINYYWTNQWELGSGTTPLPHDDPRRRPLGRLVEDVFTRYGVEVMVSETSELGERRAGWVGQVAEEAEAALGRGVPLRGVCLYPVLGMPEWHDRAQWARMGLWDLVPQSPTLARVPYEPMLAALHAAERRIAD